MSFFWLIAHRRVSARLHSFRLSGGEAGRRGDVRAEGSGNIGATNVTRVAGKAAGLLTLLLDIAKGFLAVDWPAIAAGITSAG